MQFERLNPITNERASSTHAMTQDEARAVADQAAAAFPAWARLGPSARRAILNKAASALEARTDDLVGAMMGEMGATASRANFQSHARGRYDSRGGGDDHANRRRSDPLR
jgi:benzaldehyde dehydrogenase (NAD)